MSVLAPPARARRRAPGPVRRPAAPPKPPKPPRRPAKPPKQYAPLGPIQALVRAVCALIAALLLTFVADIAVLSQLEHAASQQQLRDTYRAELNAGTAPVSEGDYNNVLLSDGVPVGIMTIPRIGLNEVIVEGTSPGTLELGPGHRRDTVLPGQAGVSVVMGRSSAYGAPFGQLQRLQPGDEIDVRTGQGMQKFTVLGLRYAGDLTPPALTSGESRLILMTARGAPFMPSGVVYVDARLSGAAQAAGARQTTTATLPQQDHALATDTTTTWALVFALQFLVVLEVLAVWAFRRFGAQKTWVVFVPILLLASLFVTDQLTRLLPNLM